MTAGWGGTEGVAMATGWGGTEVIAMAVGGGSIVVSGGEESACCGGNSC